MALIEKGIGFVCLLALTVSANVHPNSETDKPEGKIKVAAAKSISVDYEARVATPIKYTAKNYDGPYDPLDPKGIIAARHRQMKIISKKNAETIKSYVPPGIDKVAKKEVSKVMMGEGRRFAFSHPKETADLVGIALKAKKLYHTASDKVKKMENEKNEKHH